MDNKKDIIMSAVCFLVYICLILFSLCASFILVENSEIHNVIKAAIISLSLVVSIYLPLIIIDSYD